MKIVYSVTLILVLTFFCKAQKNPDQTTDSLAKVSRDRADAVLRHFDTIGTSKILYSLEDKYFYLIIEDIPNYKEYYVLLDSLGEIEKKRLLKVEDKTRRQRKVQKQYTKLLLNAEPIFDLNRYHTNYIRKIPDAKMVAGRPSYFVVKGIDGKRYGEYRLSSVTMPVPINANLWVYIVSRLTDEMARKTDSTH